MMREMEQKRERVNMARWIVGYISPLGDETPWIKGYGEINKDSLMFAAKFWWLIIKYQLFPTTSANVLTWEGATLIVSIMAQHVIDFAAILRYKIHDRAYMEEMNFLFLCLIQILCDEDKIPEIQGVNKKVLVTATAQTKIMKDLAFWTLPMRPSEPTTVPRVQFKGPSVSTEPSDIHVCDVGVSVNFEMEEQREASYLSTQGERTLAMSSLAPASSSESVGVSSLPSWPSTTAFAISMTLVSRGFLHRLVDIQGVTNERLRIIETEVATLYGQIQPWVRTRLEMVEARWDIVHRVSTSELRADLQGRIDSFKRCIVALFLEIKVTDLGYISVIPRMFLIL